MVYNSCVPSFAYKVIRKKGFSANASISISGDKGVVVRAPFWMSMGMIEGFIREKSSWIEKNLYRFNTKKITNRYTEGESQLFFGEEYILTISKSENPGKNRVEIIENKIRVEINGMLPAEKQSEKIKEALLYWYLEKGIEIITQKVNYFSNEMRVNYKRINLKNVTSIWGSCSPSNCLSFNRKLVMAPHEVVDYVVIHEVAHMRHRNHGPNFWKLVESFDSQYKYHRKWLKLNHHLLSI